MSLRICDTSPQVPQLQTWDAAKLRQASQHSTKWLPKGNWIQDPVATSQHLPANPQASDGQIGICLFYPTNIKKENVGVWTHSHQLWLPGKPCAWRSFLRPSPPASRHQEQQTTTWCEILVHRCPNNQRHPVVLDSFGFAQLQLILQSVSDFASYASSECKLRHCPTKRRCNYHPTPRGPTISQKRFTFGPQRLGWYFWQKREQVTIGRPSFGIECYWDTSC